MQSNLVDVPAQPAMTYPHSGVTAAGGHHVYHRVSQQPHGTLPATDPTPPKRPLEKRKHHHRSSYRHVASSSPSTRASSSSASSPTFLDYPLSHPRKSHRCHRCLKHRFGSASRSPYVPFVTPPAFYPPHPYSYYRSPLPAYCPRHGPPVCPYHSYGTLRPYGFRQPDCIAQCGATAVNCASKVEPMLRTMCESIKKPLYGACELLTSMSSSCCGDVSGAAHPPTFSHVPPIAHHPQTAGPYTASGNYVPCLCEPPCSVPGCPGNSAYMTLPPNVLFQYS